MNKSKTCGILLVALFGISLASCGGSGSDSQQSSSQATSRTKETHQAGDTFIEVSLKKNEIPEGGNFFDFCKPSVMLHDGDDEPEDVFDYTLQTEYVITNKADSSLTYKAGDPLPEGEYYADVRFLRGRRPSDWVEFKVVKQTVVEASEGHGYKSYSLEDLADYTYKKFSKVDTLSGGSTPSEGEAKILVIPVEFENCKFDDPNTEEDEGEIARALCQEAFFADTEDTPWESLASYYRKASHGKLNFTGMVTPVYTYHHNDTDSDLPSSLAAAIAREAIDYFRQNGTLIPSEYDSDKDGYIDGVEVIYNTTQPTPSSFGTDAPDSADTWWNYTTNASSAPSVSSPTVHRMFWSRYDYLTQNYYANSEKGLLVNGKKVDPHTIIHETGHMMGAPDYYSYAHDEGPAGCVDMMDCNVGDHNAYTKMQYGWVAPKVVDGSEDNFTITLHSFTETGEFLLVRDTENDKWNETPFDEYLVLQYYTPTNLNEMDCKGYGEWLASVSSTGGSAYGHAGTYEHPGLQVFHADGRVISNEGSYINGKKGAGKLVYTDDPRPADYVDAENQVYGSAATRYHANTGSSQPQRASQALDENGNLTSNTKVRELSIILPGGVNSFTGESYYNNMGMMTNLFGLNGVDLDGWQGNEEATSGEAKFGGSSYSNYKMRNFYPNTYQFNDGSTLNWSFEVVAQTSDSITLHFLNNAK